MGVLDGVPNAGLSCQMHDKARLLGFKQCGGCCSFSEIDSMEPEPTMGLEVEKPCFLQVWVVVAIKAIGSNYLMTGFEQPDGHMIADETSCAGDQDRPLSVNFHTNLRRQCVYFRHRYLDL